MSLGIPAARVTYVHRFDFQDEAIAFANGQEARGYEVAWDRLPDGAWQVRSREMTVSERRMLSARSVARAFDVPLDLVFDESDLMGADWQFHELAPRRDPAPVVQADPSGGPRRVCVGGRIR